MGRATQYYERTKRDKPLGPRECEVYELIGIGLPDKEIAQRLRLNTQTVKNYAASIFEKCCLSRFQIIRECALRQARAEIYAGLISQSELLK